MIDSSRRVAAALPDVVTAAAFLVAWVVPLSVGRGVVLNLMLVMLLEFMLIHSGVIIGVVVLQRGIRRSMKTLAIIALGALYMLFVLGMAVTFEQIWVIGSFVWLLAAKLAGVWLAPMPLEAEAERQRHLWMLSMAAYLGGAFATAFLPLPGIGLSDDVVARLGLEGSGIWVEEPHRMLAFGTVYFAVVAWIKWREPGLARSRAAP